MAVAAVRPDSRSQAVTMVRGWQHAGLLLLLAAAVAYQATLGAPFDVELNVDGRSTVVRTVPGTVRSLLANLPFTVHPEDVSAPPRDARLAPGMRVELRPATPIVVHADGLTLTLRTGAATVGEALLDAGVWVGLGDRLLVSGTELTPRAALPRSGSSAVSMAVQRAIEATVVIDGMVQPVVTQARSVAQLLSELGLRVNSEDVVVPGLEARLAPGQVVWVRRARPITVSIDRRQVSLRTHEPTVGDALRRAGFTITEADRVEPDLEAPVTANLRVTVTRLAERTITTQRVVARTTRTVADASLPLDTIVRTSGRDGVRKQEYRVYFEDGREVRRVLTREYWDPEPVAAEIRYGTRIVYGTVQTNQGPQQFWRKLRVFTTAYNASHGGRTRDDPNYGLTRTGMMAGRGIVAVDPTVIALYTRLFIPGYGVAVAGDTGGGVKGRWVDLGFNEDEPITWGSRWLEVYLLGEPPRIFPYILPDYPG